MTGAGQPHIGCVSTSRGVFLFSPKITWYLSRLPVCPLSTRRLGWVSSPTPWIVSTCPRGPRTPARPWKEEVPAQPGPAPPPAGFLWFECKEVWIEGLRSYLLDWWNFLDMVILSLYLAAFALRLLLAGLAHVHCKDAPDGAACRYFTSAGECPGLGPEPGPPPRSACSQPQPPRPRSTGTERREWRTEDPQFLAEVLFAVTSMLSFTRLAYILPAHESLGTLQISIGRMIDDMIRWVPPRGGAPFPRTPLLARGSIRASNSQGGAWPQRSAAKVAGRAAGGPASPGALADSAALSGARSPAPGQARDAGVPLSGSHRTAALGPRGIFWFSW